MDRVERVARALYDSDHSPVWRWEEAERSLKNTYFRQARAAIAAADAWEEIGTDTPRNESVLIFIPNAEHYGPGIYRGMLVDMGTGPHWSVNGLHFGRDCGPHNQPTRWRPLPEPPESPDAQ